MRVRDQVGQPFGESDAADTSTCPIICLNFTLRASVRASTSTGALALRRRAPGAVVRDFKDHAFPMAEERWSVAVARRLRADSPAISKPIFLAKAGPLEPQSDIVSHQSPPTKKHRRDNRPPPERLLH